MPYEIDEGKLMRISPGGQVKICLIGGVMEGVISRARKHNGIYFIFNKIGIDYKQCLIGGQREGRMCGNTTKNAPYV